MPGRKNPVPLGFASLSTVRPYNSLHSPVWFLGHLTSRSPVGVEKKGEESPWRGKVVYSQDGTYLGDDAITTNHDVHVVTQNLNSDTLSKKTEWEILEAVFKTINITEEFDVTFRELLDRAHWAYGECAGAPSIVDHYAYAINNIMNNPKARTILYGRHQKKSFFERGHGPNFYYNRFARSRRNPKALDKLRNARATIAATIGAILGSTENPIGKAILWKGGRTAEAYHKRHQRHQKDPLYKDVTFVETGEDGAFKHFFYNLTELGKKRAREDREERKKSTPGDPDDEI